jgi:hypothetical protein
MILAYGLEAGFPGRVPCHVAARAVAPGAMVEGRRDPDASTSARCRRARAAEGARPVDLAGPGVAGAARRDGAARETGRDAAARQSGHYLALASRHRPSPVGAPVAAWPVRTAGHAPQGAAGSAAALPRERVLGLPADPRRARGTGHHRGAVHGLGDPQERRDRPGTAPRRSRVARVPACGCRILCHLMQPGNIRGSGRRAGPAAEPGYLLLPRLDPRARRADSDARPGAAGAYCSDRRTHPGPAAGAVHR